MSPSEGSPVPPRLLLPRDDPEGFELAFRAAQKRLTPRDTGELFTYLTAWLGPYREAAMGDPTQLLLWVGIDMVGDAMAILSILTRPDAGRQVREGQLAQAKASLSAVLAERYALARERFDRAVEEAVAARLAQTIEPDTVALPPPMTEPEAQKVAEVFAAAAGKSALSPEALAYAISPPGLTPEVLADLTLPQLEDLLQWMRPEPEADEMTVPPDRTKDPTMLYVELRPLPSPLEALSFGVYMREKGYDINAFSMEGRKPVSYTGLPLGEFYRAWRREVQDPWEQVGTALRRIWDRPPLPRT